MWFNKIIIMKKSLKNLVKFYKKISSPMFKDRIFNSSFLSKILIIFVLGFISRLLVNQIYNVNVFVDFVNIVSILYYIFMSVFITCVNTFVDLFGLNIIPTFLIDFFNYSTSKLGNLVVKLFNIWKSISNAFTFFKKDKINLSSNTEKVFENPSDLKNSNALLSKQSDNTYIRGSSSAAVSGLYGRPTITTNRSAAIQGLYSSNISENINLSHNWKESFRFRLKGRVFWVGWKQFSNDYNSYNQYKELWDGKIRSSIKNDLLKLKNSFKK